MDLLVTISYFLCTHQDDCPVLFFLVGWPKLSFSVIKNLKRIIWNWYSGHRWYSMGSPTPQPAKPSAVETPPVCAHQIWMGAELLSTLEDGILPLFFPFTCMRVLWSQLVQVSSAIFEDGECAFKLKYLCQSWVLSWLILPRPRWSWILRDVPQLPSGNCVKFLLGRSWKEGAECRTFECFSDLCLWVWVTCVVERGRWWWKGDREIRGI